MLLGTAAVVARGRRKVSWHWLDLLLLALVLAPPLQYAFGLISFFGQMAVASTYLLGLCLAALAGRRWEEAAPGQAATGLFLAVGIAGIVSVNLQLRTWLDLMQTGMFDIWSMGLSGSRPYANLGQPNQLATLLLWGVLASGWAFHARAVGGPVAVLLAGFLLLGVALTQSRTAWIGLSFLLACSWAWRPLWRSKALPWATSGLFLYFWACYFSLSALSSWLGLAAPDDAYLRGAVGDDLRLPAWRMLANATLERPWFGYGWTEIGKAQLAVAERFPALFPVFGHAHNLALDLVLWLGIPLGAAVSLALFFWYGGRVRAVDKAQSALLVMLLGVVGIHAMLEFPLHYAYFLLPTGIVVGVLNRRAPGLRGWTSPRWTLALGWFVAAVSVVGIVRDYFEVEASYQAALYEAARIGTLPVGAPPEVLLLTQLRENINFMRYEVHEGMAPAELQALEAVATAYPGSGRAYKLAKALALNGRPAQASAWLRKVCKIGSPDDCALIQRVWRRDAMENALVAAVPWPSDD
jgi:O-antigen ligase